RRRGEADEVHLAVQEPGRFGPRRELGREHRQAGRERERALRVARHLQLRQVRARDALVAADVDDVDALDVIPEVLDRPRDDAAGDERLAETDLVGHEEAAGVVRREEETLEGVLDGAALERLQRREYRFDVRSLHALCRIFAGWRLCRTLSTTCHTA